MEIGKVFEFEAAHRLESWPMEHQCWRMHGHSYKVEVVLEGPVMWEGDRPGVVVDFGLISEVWREEIHSRVDHRYLNEVMEVQDTTAEVIAMWIAQRLKKRLAGLKEIVVWETESAYARYIVDV